MPHNNPKISFEETESTIKEKASGEKNLSVLKEGIDSYNIIKNLIINLK